MIDLATFINDFAAGQLFAAPLSADAPPASLTPGTVLGGIVPDPIVCWSCDKPVGGLYIYTPDGPECGACTKLGAETLKAELGMTPEEFILDGRFVEPGVDPRVNGIRELDTLAHKPARVESHENAGEISSRESGELWGNRFGDSPDQAVGVTSRERPAMNLGSQHGRSCSPGLANRDTVGNSASNPETPQATAESGDAGSSPVDSTNYSGRAA